MPAQIGGGAAGVAAQDWGSGSGAGPSSSSTTDLLGTTKGAGLLLIWGLRVFYRTIGQGVFHCRRCGGDRHYRLRSGRRFFTLFFIPVIPLNKVG